MPGIFLGSTPLTPDLGGAGLQAVYVGATKVWPTLVGYDDNVVAMNPLSHWDFNTAQNVVPIDLMGNAPTMTRYGNNYVDTVPPFNLEGNGKYTFGNSGFYANNVADYKDPDFSLAFVGNSRGTTNYGNRQALSRENSSGSSSGWRCGLNYSSSGLCVKLTMGSGDTYSHVWTTRPIGTDEDFLVVVWYENGEWYMQMNGETPIASGFTRVPSESASNGLMLMDSNSYKTSDGFRDNLYRVTYFPRMVTEPERATMWQSLQ